MWAGLPQHRRKSMPVCEFTDNPCQIMFLARLPQDSPHFPHQPRQFFALAPQQGHGMGDHPLARSRWAKSWNEHSTHPRDWGSGCQIALTPCAGVLLDLLVGSLGMGLSIARMPPVDRISPASPIIPPLSPTSRHAALWPAAAPSTPTRRTKSAIQPLSWGRSTHTQLTGSC